MSAKDVALPESEDLRDITFFFSLNNSFWYMYMYSYRFTDPRIWPTPLYITEI